MNLSQLELVQRGYPPRPAPDTGGYEKWLKMVSKPITIVSPHDIERAELHFGPATDRTDPRWSGLVPNNGRYSISIATFNVPAFVSTGSGSNAAVWGGLDNSGLALIQDGIFYQVAGTVGSYSSWFEYLPAAPQFQPFPITPGNSMTFVAWEGDISCTLGSPAGAGFGCFYWQDNTAGIATTIFVVTGNGNFAGSTCEGVFERQASSSLASWSLDAYMRSTAMIL
jgi:hypothetical protein